MPKSFPKIEAVLFDLDGTLVDTETLSDQAVVEVLRPHLPPNILDGLAQNDNKMPWELKKRTLGMRGAEWAPIVLDYAARHWSIPPGTMEPQTLWDRWEDVLNDMCDHVQPCAGAAQLVQRLAAANVPMALATSSRASGVRNKTARFAWCAHLRAVVPGDDPAVKNGKPAPDPYLEAARRLGVNPSNCLVFEDGLPGVRSGKAAGCIVILVPDARFSQQERDAFAKEADVVLHSLQDFDGAPFGLDLPSVAAVPK